MPNLMLVPVSFWLTLSALRRQPGPVLLIATAVLGLLLIAFGWRLFVGTTELTAEEVCGLPASARSLM